MSEQIPEGYMKDAQGKLVPLELVKDVDKARSELVLEIVAKAKVQKTALAEFKMATMGDIQAFIELSAEKYGVKWGGAKGNVTLTSYDGRYKIVRAIAEYITFDERLQAAKALIDECIRDWSEGVRPEIMALVNDAFQVDKEGKVSTTRILGLRRLDIHDDTWIRAMQAITDSVQVAGSKTYIRVYERVGDGEEFRQISLDIATA